MFILSLSLFCTISILYCAYLSTFQDSSVCCSYSRFLSRLHCASTTDCQLFISFPSFVLFFSFQLGKKTVHIQLSLVGRDICVIVNGGIAMSIMLIKEEGISMIIRILNMATSTLPILEPKSLVRPTHWSKEVENAYRFQLAGYRDEFEYKSIRQVTEVSERRRRMSNEIYSQRIRLRSGPRVAL